MADMDSHFKTHRSLTSPWPRTLVGFATSVASVGILLQIARLRSAFVITVSSSIGGKAGSLISTAVRSVSYMILIRLFQANNPVMNPTSALVPGQQKVNSVTTARALVMFRPTVPHYA